MSHNLLQNISYILSYIYLQTLRSVQDACHASFVIDLALRGVSVAQW